MLSVFGDESADEKQERVFAVAGVIGRDYHWEQLEAKWFARTWGVPFHAKDCDSDQGQYADKPHGDNKALYRDLTILLAESGLCGWGFAIDLIAQREIFPDAPNISYYKCFLEVVEAMKRFATANQETVQFTFDMRRESEYNTGLLYNMMCSVPDYKKHLFSRIAFECSQENPRLQPADLMARETMKALDNYIGPVKRGPRKSWLALYKTNRFSIETISRQWFEWLLKQMPTMVQSTGMSTENYRRWLKKNNLPENLTTLFLFWEWSGKKRDK